MFARSFVAVAVLALPVLGSHGAWGATQTVLGKSFVVKDPAAGADDSKRTVVALGRELTADDTLVGNPVASGATVDIIANGTTSTTQTFVLPGVALAAGQPGWKALGNPVLGYLWKDANGVHGPIKSALIKKANGAFLVKVVIKGSLGPITVVPPAPGTSGGMKFTLGAGDTYCVNFGGAAGGKVGNAPAKGTPNKVFKVVTTADLPTFEAGCPAPAVATTTTSSSTSSSSSTSTTSSTTTSTISIGTCAFALKWGTTGSGDGQLIAPAGVARDASGNVYVADSGNDRVQKFSATGTFLAKFGTSGAGNGQFTSPGGVAVDGSGNIYVADTANNRIQKLTSAGAFVTAWGTSGTNDGEFDSPTAVAVDGSGNVFVVDSNNNRVQKFTSGGTFVSTWGVGGSANGEFASPFGIGTDASGNVYVADAGNNRIQKFSGTGTFVTTWGNLGTGDGEFVGTAGVAADASFVYASDLGNNRIQKFSPTGTYLDKGGFPGSANGEFSTPAGIVADGSGGVYVADYGNDRIQKFVCP
jgi:NHL repeat-containing protein